mgnify:CR=1 FL=1
MDAPRIDRLLDKALKLMDQDAKDSRRIRDSNGGDRGVQEQGIDGFIGEMRHPFEPARRY